MYRIFAEGYKIHLTTNFGVCWDVADNLKRRYNIFGCISKHSEENEWLFDPGKAVIQNDIKFKFVLSDGLSIVCRSMHWNLFCEAITMFNTDTFLKKYDGKFYKLHGYMSILCLNEKQKNELVDLVNKKINEYNFIHETTMQKVYA